LLNERFGCGCANAWQVIVAGKWCAVCTGTRAAKNGFLSQVNLSATRVAIEG